MTDQSEPRRGRPSTTVATRLAVAALVVSITSLATATVVLSVSAQHNGEQLLRERVDTVAAAKADEVDAFFAQTGRQIAGLALTTTVRGGLPAFAGALSELDDATPEQVTAARTTIADYYLDEFIPVLEAATGDPVDPLSVDPGRDPATVYLQNAYIAENQLEPDQRALLTDAGDGSRWTDVHRDLHPELRAVADGYGWDDILLIDDDVNIVYSVAKDVDFATNLTTGPYRTSALARLVSQTLRTGLPGTVTAADFDRYVPALGQPVLFVAAPVSRTAAGPPIGVIAVRIGADHVSDIMTQDWRDGLLGETGEVYLLGADRLMRSEARLFAEDSAAYLEQADATADERRLMSMLGTTTLIQRVNDPAVVGAVTDPTTGQVDGRNVLGVPSVTTVQPVDAMGLSWAIVSQQSLDEVLAPVDSLLRTSLIGTAIFVVALTFLIVIWANRFVNPVRTVSGVLRRVEGGDLAVRATPEGPREFRSLAADVNQMISGLDDRERRLTAAMSAKVRLVRRLLPPSAADRVGTGDRQLLESVPHASVAVVVIDGLDEIASGESAERCRALVHRFLDELDRLAGQHGLERIKVVGDTYHAACGLNTPYLDHTPRAVTFAVAAVNAVRQVGAAESVSLDAHAGVHTGAVTMGLIGHSRLVYDQWGDTVDEAQRLGDRARPSQILISDDVHERLPADYPVRPADGDGIWVVDPIEVSA